MRDSLITFDRADSRLRSHPLIHGRKAKIRGGGAVAAQKNGSEKIGTERNQVRKNRLASQKKCVGDSRAFASSDRYRISGLPCNKLRSMGRSLLFRKASLCMNAD